MTVYAVFSYYSSCHDTFRGVFSTREDALDFIMARREEDETYEILECPLGADMTWKLGEEV